MKKLLWLLIIGLMSSDMVVAGNYYNATDDADQGYSWYNPKRYWYGNPSKVQDSEMADDMNDEDYYGDGGMEEDYNDQDMMGEDEYMDEEEMEEVSTPVVESPSLITRIKNVVAPAVTAVKTTKSVNPANTEVVDALTELNMLAQQNSIGKLGELAQDSLSEFSKNSLDSVNMVRDCMESAARFISDKALTDMSAVDNPTVARMQELIASVQSALPSVS